MADIVAPDVRSRMMAGIRNKDTKPEMTIRKGLHRLGFRFLLHDKRFPGKPDLIFPKWRAAIFVNGCFWHGHDCARGSRTPKANRDYWLAKVARNKARDAAAEAALKARGWRVETIWECELKDQAALDRRLRRLLQDPLAPAKAGAQADSPT